MEEVLVEWAKAVHRENPVVDAHLDLGSGMWWSGGIFLIFGKLI